MMLAAAGTLTFALMAWVVWGAAAGPGLCMGGDRPEGPGYLSIEPDTDGGCVWWLDVISPVKRVHRFHFPTRVRCQETRAVVVELLGGTWRVDQCR